MPIISYESTAIVADASHGPTTQAFGDMPAVGASVQSSRSDHKHGLPTSPGIHLVNTQGYSGTPTQGQYTDIDLSGVVGAIPAVVMLAIDGGDMQYYFRPKGDTHSQMIGGVSYLPGGTYPVRGYVLVKTNSDGVIQVYQSGAGGLTVTVVAYWA